MTKHTRHPMIKAVTFTKDDAAAERDRLKAVNAELLAALEQAEIAVEQLCHGQDLANQCWVTLTEIRAAIAKARGTE